MARGLYRRLVSAVPSTRSARRMSRPRPRAAASQESACSGLYSDRTSVAIRRMTSAAARATSWTASLAGRTYSGGATAAPTTTPTTAPITVSTIRPSTAMSEPPTARISIALIGTSAMSSPRRNSRPITSDTATASPRLHQVSGTTVDRAAANSTPSTTLATRSSPRRTVS